MRDKLVLTLGILCAVAFILLAGMVGYHMGEGATTPAPVATVDLPPAAAASATPTAQATAPEGSITIPGFDKLQITASTGQQAAPFYNPAGNACYFVISLFLPSGEEIFRSGLVSPGESLSTMALASVPPAGTYESSILRYSCYSLKRKPSPHFFPWRFSWRFPSRPQQQKPIPKFTAPSQASGRKPLPSSKRQPSPHTS